jgi:hypothetical protein
MFGGSPSGYRADHGAATRGPALSAVHCEPGSVLDGPSFDGLHHEIYLSDPRRIPPERLKTILRRPVE